jgi:hypothetical protein
MMYTYSMEVPITQFRREIFTLTNRALEGGEVWFTHKGRRLKLVPEGKPVSRLSRITPLDIVAEGVDLEDDSWKHEMMRAWERKWDELLGPMPGSGEEQFSAPKPATASRKHVKA